MAGTTTPGEAAITSYLVDTVSKRKIHPRAFVRADHRGDGLWRVESVVDPEVGYWSSFTTQRELLDNAAGLASLLHRAAVAEDDARHAMTRARRLARQRTAELLEREISA